MITHLRNTNGEIVKKPKKAFERYCEILDKTTDLYLYPIIEVCPSGSKRLSLEITNIKIESFEDKKTIESVVLYRTPACNIMPARLQARAPKARFKQAFEIACLLSFTLTVQGANVYLPFNNNTNVPALPKGPPYSPLAQQQMKVIRHPYLAAARPPNIALALFDPEEVQGLVIDAVTFVEP